MAQKYTTNLRTDLRVIGYCLIVGLSATAFGFDQGETAGFLAMKQFVKDFGHFDKTTGTYMMSAGAQTCMYGVEIGFVLVAAAISGPIGTRYGRKRGLALCSVVGIAGSGIQMIAHYPAAVVGRALMGMAIGFAGQFCIPYWSEVAPVQLRGIVVIFYQFFINLANFIGSCIDEATYDFPNRWAYRAPLLTTMGPPLALLALLFLVPESPRWLVTRNRFDEARASIRKIRGEHVPQEELDSEINEVIAFNEIEKLVETSTSYRQCLMGTDLRRTLIATLVVSGQQLMGIGFIAGYSTYFFSIIGFDDAFLITVIVSACEIFGVFVAFSIIKYIGRRPILVVGAFAQGFCMLAFAIVAEAAPHSVVAAKFLIMFICVFCFAFSVTWGSVGNVVMGEVPSNRLRSKTISIAMSVSWVVCLAVITAVPYLLSADYANLGTKIGFIFGGISVFVFLAAYFFLPETKDRSLEEIDEMFMNRVPTSKFKTYQCIGEGAGYSVRDFEVHGGIKKLETVHVTRLEER